MSDDTSPIRCSINRPVERAFVYLDVSDFSQMEPLKQLAVLRSLINLTDSSERWQSGVDMRAFGNREASLCIGDGYIFCFTDTVLAAYFAARLARLIEMSVAEKSVPEVHFRIGVHAGPVFRFFDPGRKDWNYVGTGINDGSRVLEAIGKEVDDVVFVSGAVKDAMLLCTEAYSNPKLLLNRGRRKDKHGEMRRVYEFRHIDMMEVKD